MSARRTTSDHLGFSMGEISLSPREAPCALSIEPGAPRPVVVAAWPSRRESRSDYQRGPHSEREATRSTIGAWGV